MVGYVNICFMKCSRYCSYVTIAGVLLPAANERSIYTLCPGPHGMLRHVLLHAPLIWCWCQSSMTAEVFRACATCNTAALFSDNWKNSQMSSILALSLPEVPAPCSICFLQITHTLTLMVIDVWQAVHLYPALAVKMLFVILGLLWLCIGVTVPMVCRNSNGPGLLPSRHCKTDYMWADLQIRTPTNNLPPEADKSSTWHMAKMIFLPSNVALMHDHFRALWTEKSPWSVPKLKQKIWVSGILWLQRPKS